MSRRPHLSVRMLERGAMPESTGRKAFHVWWAGATLTLSLILATASLTWNYPLFAQAAIGVAILCSLLLLYKNLKSRRNASGAKDANQARFYIIALAACWALIIVPMAYVDSKVAFTLTGATCPSWWPSAPPPSLSQLFKDQSRHVRAIDNLHTVGIMGPCGCAVLSVSDSIRAPPASTTSLPAPTTRHRPPHHPDPSGGFIS